MEPNPGPRTAFGPQWRICHVESLTTKFQIHYFTEINALYQRNVCVPILRSANGLARTGTDRKLRGLNEGGGIEKPVICDNQSIRESWVSMARKGSWSGLDLNLEPVG